MSDIPSRQRVQERIRESKRRHRTRKKEYVEELERKLRDYQQQGVQAAPEVQVAALRVVEENIRLRELLRRVGVDNCTLQGRSHRFIITEDMLAGRRNRIEYCQNNIRGDLRPYTAEPPRCSSERPTKHSTDHRPCKLMIILTENPSIDITHTSAQSEDQN